MEYNDYDAMQDQYEAFLQGAVHFCRSVYTITIPTEE